MNIRQAASRLGTLVSTLLGAVPYHLGYVIPREPSIWVFGAWEGRKYADNSRALFEHVRQRDPAIRAVWLARNRALVADLRERGHEAHLAHSFMGYWLTARAGIAIVCYSAEDVNRLGLAGARTMQLWHGIPLKTIGRDGPDQGGKQPWLRAIAARWWFRLFPFRKTLVAWTCVCSTSPEVSRRMASAFGSDETQVVVTGYPRNDVLSLASPPLPPLLDSLRRQRDFRRVVAYLPTFRKDGGVRTLLAGFDSAEMEAMLAERDALLLIKLHPADREVANLVAVPSDRIVWLTDHELPDLNRLLPWVDVLVSDYSGAYLDYLLLDRPMVFTPFDREQYLRTYRGLYEDYDTATPGPKAGSWAAAVAEIGAALDGHDPYGPQRAMVRHRYHTYVDADSSERCYRLATLVACDFEEVESPGP